MLQFAPIHNSNINVTVRTDSRFLPFSFDRKSPGHFKVDFLGNSIERFIQSITSLYKCIFYSIILIIFLSIFYSIILIIYDQRICDRYYEIKDTRTPRTYLREEPINFTISFRADIGCAFAEVCPLRHVRARARETMTKEWREVTIGEFQVKMFPDSGIVSRDAINS